MSDKFIISTYNLNDSSQYVFSKKVLLEETSAILKFFVNFKGYSNKKIERILYGYFSEIVNKHLEKLTEEEKKLFIDEVKNTSGEEDAKDVTDIDDLIEYEKCRMAFAKVIQDVRFSYFVPDNSSNNPGNNVIAVKCLDNTLTKDLWKDWINALIEDNTCGTPGKDDVLYLMLHDKDVPRYDGKTFKILTPNEISDLGILGTLEENHEKGECRWIHETKGFEIKILVFNHVGNAIENMLDKTKIKDNDILEERIKSIFNNHLVLNGIFEGNQALFNELDPNGFVDLGDGVFNSNFFHEATLSSGRKYYYYEDKNGALLTELMHVKSNVKAASEFEKIVNWLTAPAWDVDNKKIKVQDVKNMRFPFIIKIYKSFFKDWADAVVDKLQKTNILYNANKKALMENLERSFSFFNNSSIWIRLVDMYDEKAFKTAVAEFEYFDKIGLYVYNSAWENLEYNLRIFSENYLESALNGHGNYVTPMLYGNETEAHEILCGNHRKA